MIKLNKNEVYDKIKACWIGKNIGGTLGGPTEGKKEILNVTGFASKAGEPLPNDDLDLQLVWLKALYDHGPKNINSKLLGEYWLTFISPTWNEYGVGKANMMNGFLPPMSGSVDNADWMHSNGAWIRTEVWACSFPAMPEYAIKMAFEDASVDHGYGEGTFAAIFVAAMESAAFVNGNIYDLLDIGLSKIPENCRVARSVRLVMGCYEKGMDWKDARNAVVEDSSDLGWFQAPANVAFVVLGLLYGGCEFKKSMLYAINCGDDTDCTAATLGALLGIMYGTKGIPQDWAEYIGDAIKTICIRQNPHHFPQSCTDLTDRVMALLNVTLNAYTDFRRGTKEVELTDGATDLSELNVEAWKGCKFANSIASRAKHAIEQDCVYAHALIELFDEPVAEPMGEIHGRLTVTTLLDTADKEHIDIKWFLPDGFSVKCRKNILLQKHTDKNETCSAEFTITAGETVSADNDVLLWVKSSARPTGMCIPIHLLG